MGYDRHHAIAVTSYSRADIDAAHAAAIDIFNNPQDMWVIEIVTPILTSPANVWYTFFVGPDGGKGELHRWCV